MANINELVKAIAMEAYKGSKPACLMCGKVTSASPLKVKISDKLELDGDNLVIPESLTDHYVFMDIEKDSSTTYDFVVLDSLQQEQSLDVKKAEFTKAKVKVYNALKKNDELLLFRQPGGQKFYIIDRTVRAE